MRSLLDREGWVFFFHDERVRYLARGPSAQKASTCFERLVGGFGKPDSVELGARPPPPTFAQAISSLNTIIIALGLTEHASAFFYLEG